ncbi:ganglioside GM2 activator-like [Saccostrea echinata]|uniref:ganglioside GM2 activator-like n=1 Tax=Saccostrea echinata TaxID=191078 RepID=UPI002A83F66A|nr:ganglioside GM2 activator-like [Saccostrea echinata]
MKAIILLLSVLTSSEATVTWRDCVPSSTAHPYVTFTSVSISPDLVVLPGNVTIGVQGTVHHHFGKDVRMVVHMDKYLLGVWSKVPCHSNVGSCNYDNPCEFLSAFATSGTCPHQLEAHGLPCTCPFNPSDINLPPSVFEVTKINAAWNWLATGKFRVQAEMIHGNDIVGCFHVEMDIKVIGGGFIFG